MKQARAMMPDAFTERDSVLREVEQLLMLARTVSLGPEFDDILKMAVERATDRLVAAARRRSARLAALSAIQQTVAMGFDLPAIMADVYEHLREILDAPSFNVFAYDPVSGSLQCAFAVIDNEILTTDTLASVPLGDGPAAQVVRDGRPRIVNDALRDHGSRRVLLRGGRALVLRSGVFVPMHKGDDVIGVMQAQSYHPEAYSPEDVEFLSTIANQTAMAMTNARLYEEALRHSREVEALLVAANELGHVLEPEQVLERVMKAAADLVDAGLATFGMYGPNGLHFDRLWQYGAWRRIEAVADADCTLPCCSPSQPLLDNAPGPHAAGPLAAALPVLHSRLVVPVRGRDKRPLGVIQLFNKRSGRGFARRDLELTEALASHAAMALERATSYRSMEQSRNYLQTLMDRSYAAIFVLDPAQGRILDVNAAGIQLLGHTRDEILARRVYDLAPSESVDTWRTVLQSSATANATVEQELTILDEAGLPIPLEVTVTPVDLNDNQALVCLCIDRRPRIRQEEAERLRALGLMASGVAHDFNNMLTVIRERARMLLAQASHSADEGTAGELMAITRAADDAAETVKRLQAFSGIKKVETDNAVCDLPQVIRDTVELTRARWKDAAQQRGVTIDIEMRLGETPAAAAPPADLREVLVNLVFNAVDAMPEGGLITLSSGAEGARVWVEVADTGTGMPESVRNRVFEPFFTTKGIRGNGLGLSASYGIITALGGTIRVDSTPGVGTTFLVELPVGSAQEKSIDLPPEPMGALRLLVVDDDPQMLRTTEMMLDMEGHEVVTAPGGRLALDALELATFDAVLTDLGMPDINGVQLAEMIRARGYSLPILLITGWGLELELEQVRQAGVTDILPKPFTPIELARKLATAVHSQLVATT